MRVELLCLDVDGTLTDGSLIYGFVGNSPLGLHSADLANFGEQQTTSLVVSPKFAKNHESQTENPSVVDSAKSQNLVGNQTKIAESSDKIKLKKPLKSFCYFWLLPKVESSLLLNPNLPNNADSAESQNLNQNNSVRSTQTRPLRGAKNREQGCRSATADFLLEAEKRGSPPKSEKRQLLARRGSGAGGAALLREESSENDKNGGKVAESARDSSPMAQNDNNNAPKSKSQQAEFAEILKVFNAKDGLALAYWCKTLKRTVAIITGKKSEILRKRASELGIKFLFMGIKDKGEIVRGLKKDLALDSAQVACVGDDLNDISMFAESSLNFAPNDCASHLKTLPNITLLNANGGCGAVREAIEIILQKEGIYEDFIGFFAR